MRKILSIVETAYRATLEEQDDTILWITQACKNAGADVSLLLRGNAVNYLARGQDASGLSFGELRQTNPPDMNRDLRKMAEKGVKLYCVREDLAERGISEGEVWTGAENIGRAELPALLEQFDQVWHW
jgi:sulfur relay (sulfurtransferase) DsrF/TusC family protein